MGYLRLGQGWRRLLRVPWTARRSNQAILKEIGPECSLEGKITDMASLRKYGVRGLLWWFNGSETMLPMQGPWVYSLVKELDLTCHD